MVATDISLVGDSERDFLPILQRYERAAEPRGSMLQVVAKSAPAPHTLDRIELPASQPPIVSCGDKFPRIRLRPHIISRLEAAPGSAEPGRFWETRIRYLPPPFSIFLLSMSWLLSPDII